ncbi:helix-turn-helix domain-containing protein [Vibrio neonatus]|uniref:helix-turn-helix domain-containing protein n=1 Tax=Vibrio neonatus TaxID=278860 RepID=UPI0021C302C4|nr:AraC family transcriptional regulator [Vibrio neonatus]
MQSKGYWLGKSMQQLPACTAEQVKIDSNFSEFGSDISILSRKEVKVAHFYYSEEFKFLFELSLKICQNLGKKIIAIYDKEKSLANYYDTSHVTFVCSNSEYQKEAFFQSLSYDENDALTSPTLDYRMKKIEEYISVNINRDIREEEVAELSNLSINYFSRFFRKHRKVSFQDYITLKRVNIAQQLLVDSPAEKVSSVAYQAGYSDVSYFNRVFKKHTTMTPTQYRKLNI